MNDTEVDGVFMPRKAARSGAIKNMGRRKSKLSAESRAFRKGLAVRGEAVEVNDTGTLPEGATHQIVNFDTDGLPVVKRRRFSLLG
jgi:hypothetical protein